jgi:cytochrome c-type biogenesis protein
MGLGVDLNVGLVFLAGILSFLSPCILPLIPAYLSLMGGTTIQQLKESGSRRRGALLNSVFFVLGFSIVFIVLGILFSSTFALIGGVTQIINIIAGVIIILLGFNFIFDFWKFVNFEKRFQMKGRPTSKPASLIFGMAFGAGWSPCIGPILSTILFLAGTTGSIARGVFLLSVYSLGLGLPFLLTGVFLPFALRQLDRIKKHLGTIRVASGVLLISIGALILFGRLQKFNIILFSAAYRLETWEQENPLMARNVFGALFLGLALLLVVLYLLKIVRRRRTALTEEQLDISAAESRPSVPVIRIVFTLVFLAAGTLSFVGVINLSQFLSAWFSFQGL